MTLEIFKAHTKSTWQMAWRLLLPSLFGISAPALALKCGDTETTFAHSYKEASYVFVGTPYRVDLPLELEPVGDTDQSRGTSFVLSGPKAADIRDQIFGHAQADFIIFKLYKGEPATMPRIRFGRAMGDLDPQLGMGYLIFADANGNTGVCYGSDQSIQYLVRDGEEIRKLEAALKAAQIPIATGP